MDLSHGFKTGCQLIGRDRFLRVADQSKANDEAKWIAATQKECCGMLSKHPFSGVLPELNHRAPNRAQRQWGHRNVHLVAELSRTAVVVHWVQVHVRVFPESRGESFDRVEPALGGASLWFPFEASKLFSERVFPQLRGLAVKRVFTGVLVRKIEGDCHKCSQVRVRII